VADGTSRLLRLESDQAAGAVEVSRVAESIAELDALGRRLEALEAAQAESARTETDVAPRVEELTSRLHEIDRERARVTEELARVSGRLDVDVSSLRDEVAALHMALERASVAPERQLAEVGARLEETTKAETQLAASVGDLVARVDAVQRGREVAASEIVQLSELVAAERASLRNQLDALGVTLAEQQARRSDRSQAELAELGQRLDAVERAGIAATSEVERLAALRSEELVSMAARLDGDSETRDVVADLSDRVDAVAGKVASLEADETDGSPELGDGRFRVELRRLALRMEHVEAEAREDREAVLVELERLASQVESLQRLDAGNGNGSDGQVHARAGDAVPSRNDP
jgi:hypothetical protein